MVNIILFHLWQQFKNSVSMANSVETFTIQVVHLQHTALHRPLLQIAMSVMHWKTIKKSFDFYTSFHLFGKSHHYTEYVDCISTLFNNWKSFLTFSKKIVKTCLFLRSTSTECKPRCILTKTFKVMYTKYFRYWIIQFFSIWFRISHKYNSIIVEM